MSLNAATIELLLAKGLSGDDLLAVARAMEQRKPDPTNAARQARHREKNNAVTVTRYETTETAPPPLPPLKVSPYPFKITPPIPPTPTNDLRRAKRLSDEWMPAEPTGKAVAMIDRWQSGELERELAKFRNYWIGKAGKDACKTDWQRTWINWLISADERKSNGQQHHSNLGRGAQTFARLNLSDDRPM